MPTQQSSSKSHLGHEYFQFVRYLMNFYFCTISSMYTWFLPGVSSFEEVINEALTFGEIDLRANKICLHACDNA